LRDDLREQDSQQELNMRALLVIALGLAGVGSFAELALAEKQVMNCQRIFTKCDNQAKTSAATKGCMQAEYLCINNNRAMGYDSIGKPLPPDPPKPPPNNTVIILPSGDPPKGVGGEPDSPTGDSFVPYKGLSTSKPTGRTVNGKVEMVTEGGKIWLWNGKTTQVMVLDTSRRQQYTTVRQGDPDVHMTAVVDGKAYNVASPAYAEAIAKKQAQAPKPTPPSLPPGNVCSGWGCPKPGPNTSTVVQESGVKPKSPISSTQVGGLNAGGSQSPNGPTKIAAPVATPAAPASVQRPVMPQLPQSQQYKLQNKQF
jgi:hypothetical protein